MRITGSFVVEVGDLAFDEPETVVTGPGPAMQGAAMRLALHELAQRFDELAVPEQGKYVENPTDAASGTAYDPT